MRALVVGAGIAGNEQRHREADAGEGTQHGEIAPAKGGGKGR